MTAYTGNITDGPSDTANQLFADQLATWLVAEGWVVLRAVNAPGADREYILNSDGVSGTEDLYIGIRSYQNPGADIYNLSFAIFNGYVGSELFEDQPGYEEAGCPAENLDISYWVSLTKNRLVFGIRVGTPVYEVVYVGRVLPYALPGQWPYPMAVFGPFQGQAETRYSDAHEWSIQGQRAGGYLRLPGNVDITPRMWPYRARVISNRASGISAGTGDGAFQKILRDGGGSFYSLLSLVMHDTDNIYGELEGIYYISGFNNGPENTLVINAKNYVVMQNVNQTNFDDYIALELV